MRITVFMLLFVTSILLAPLAQANGLVLTRSAHSVGETVDRLEAALRAKGVTIVARIDHSANAARVDTRLQATQLLIFGNPKLGSPLLTANPQVGIDLPMKALAWQDADGNVWLAYNAPEYVVKRHNITNRAEVVAKMSGALKKFASEATAR